MKCSRTFHRCIKLMIWASLCIFLPLMGLTETFPTKVDSQNAHKMPNLKYPLSKENGVSFYNERHPLLKRCFQPFLKCMRQMGGASLCILLPFMGLTELCFAKVDCQIAQNTRGCWGYTLSVPKWLVILNGEAYIAYEVFQNHPEMHEIDGRSS